MHKRPPLSITLPLVNPVVVLGANRLKAAEAGVQFAGARRSNHFVQERRFDLRRDWKIGRGRTAAQGRPGTGNVRKLR